MVNEENPWRRSKCKWPHFSSDILVFWILTFRYNHPNGTSFKALHHWSQIIKLGEFRKFGYNIDKNKELYGEEIPPMYNISQIKDIPIALMTGKHDMLSTPTDAKWLKEQLSTNGRINLFCYANYRFRLTKILKGVRLWPHFIFMWKRYELRRRHRETCQRILIRILAYIYPLSMIQYSQ